MKLFLDLVKKKKYICSTSLYWILLKKTTFWETVIRNTEATYKILLFI